MDNTDLINRIQAATSGARSYPQVAHALAALGIRSYTVDVSSSITLYRFADGTKALKMKDASPHALSPAFNRQKTLDAIRDSQRGKTDYPAFMLEIAKAGVRFYEATVAGENPSVLYVGIGGFYEEAIPAWGG